MKAINLDFAPRRRGRFVVLASLAAVIAIGVLLERQRVAETELDNWQRKWRILETRTGQPMANRTEQNRFAGEIAQANRIIDRLGLPWGDLFAAIDATVVDDVTLLSVEPDLERKEVRISAEAKDRKAMLNYARILQQSKTLTNGYIVSHQINNQDPQKPVRFSVVAIWSGAASGGQVK
ncbi:MAG: hypothetical protein HY066_04625 [Betaproteobacteria bacterium]|nr:hypothetical protein [Betaproteobacteria bacterium]